MKNLHLSPADIKSMSYPDFIGVMGLENITLGGEFSIDYWISKSHIGKDSMILETACSTGFNLRKCVNKTMAYGVGIDKSKPSIQYAIQKSMEEEINKRVCFQVGNTGNLPFSFNSFTHVISGMSFAFIEKKYKTLEEIQRVLVPEGYLLVTTPFYKQLPEGDFLNKSKNIFDLKVSFFWGYREWNKFFSTFFILKDEVSLISPAKEHFLKEEVFDYVLNGSHNLQNSSLEVKQICARRLWDIHLTINKNARYQMGKLQVWQLS